MWWIVPAYVQSKYGVDFLKFTEQPGTVWGTTSATESLRLMGFWLSYVGIGFTGRAIPYFDDAKTLLFSLPVVVGTLLLPAAGLTSFLSARRWRYGPFFLVLVLAGVLIMLAGFPEGTPLRHGLTFTYNHVAAVRFLRASYKAAPLVAIGLACLAGAGAGAVWSVARGRAPPARSVAGAGGRRRPARSRPRRVAVRDRTRPGPRRSRSSGFRRPGWAPHATSTASFRRTPARSSCPASCSRSTPGAGRSIRSSRR